MYKKKKPTKKKTRVHVPAVVWQVFLHTLWQQRHLLSPEIWSQTDPCAPLTHSDHPGGFLSSRGVQMRSPSAAPTSTCRWFMEQCDGYSPEICFCLLSFLRRCGWRKGGEGVKGSRLHSLPDFSSVIHHPHAFIHPPIQPSTPLDMWFFLGTTKKKKQLHPSLVPLRCVCFPAQNILRVSGVTWTISFTLSLSFFMVLMWFRYHSTSLLEMITKRVPSLLFCTNKSHTQGGGFHISAQTGMNDLRDP